MSKIYTKEERAKILESIEKEKANGVSTLDACKKLDISVSHYYNWSRRKQKKKKLDKPKVKHQTILVPKQPEPENAEPFVFKGDPRAVADFIHRLSQNYGGKQ